MAPREQIAKNRTILEELEAGNTDGSDFFPEIQSEIEHLKAQIAQSGLIVAASEKIRTDPTTLAAGPTAPVAQRRSE